MVLTAAIARREDNVSGENVVVRPKSFLFLKFIEFFGELALKPLQIFGVRVRRALTKLRLDDAVATPRVCFRGERDVTSKRGLATTVRTVTKYRQAWT